MSEIDWNGELQTEDGRKVHFVGTMENGQDGENFIVAFPDDEGTYFPSSFDERGHSASACTNIINAPPPMVEREGWILIEGDGHPVDRAVNYDSEEIAKQAAEYNDRGEIVARITWTEPAPEPEPEPEADDGLWVLYREGDEVAHRYRCKADAVGDMAREAVFGDGENPHILARLVPVDVGDEGDG